MNAVNLLNIVAAINQTLVLLKEEGISWNQLKDSIHKAELEGRRLGIEDLVLLQAKDDEERAKLQAAIEAGRK